MSTATIGVQKTIGAQRRIRARRAGFLSQVMTVAARALRSILRDPEGVIPPLIFPVFFFVVNIGVLQDVAERLPGIDYKEFQLPVAIIFAVTGISRAVTLVTDIQTGYFDLPLSNTGEPSGDVVWLDGRRLCPSRCTYIAGSLPLASFLVLGLKAGLWALWYSCS